MGYRRSFFPVALSSPPFPIPFSPDSQAYQSAKLVSGLSIPKSPRNDTVPSKTSLDRCLLLRSFRIDSRLSHLLPISRPPCPLFPSIRPALYFFFSSPTLCEFALVTSLLSSAESLRVCPHRCVGGTPCSGLFSFSTSLFPSTFPLPFPLTTDHCRPLLPFLLPATYFFSFFPPLDFG